MTPDAFILDIGGSCPTELFQALEQLGRRPRRVEAPAGHAEGRAILAAQSPGIVFIPAIWTDLLCVKLVEEAAGEALGHAPVLYGDIPTTTMLAAVFNAGLISCVEPPYDAGRLKVACSRAETALVRRLQEMERASKNGAPSVLDARLLGMALVDAYEHRGAIFGGGMKALCVSSSQAQAGELAGMLRRLGMTVFTAATIAEAKPLLEIERPRLLIADGVLADGDAPKLSSLAAKTLGFTPRVVVWSSSPELLPPPSEGGHVDDVIRKPGAESGIASILPVIVAGMYQAFT